MKKLLYAVSIWALTILPLHSYDLGKEGSLKQGNPSQLPYSAIVYITNTLLDAHCSGAMIGDFAVLTAAHCVKSGFKLMPKEYFEVRRGGSRGPVAHVEQIYITEAATKLGLQSAEFDKVDYAVLILDKPFGKNNQLRVKPVKMRKGDKIAVIGFPSGKSPEAAWYAQGEVTRVDQEGFSHHSSTEPGTSGAPTFFQNNLREIIAVNTGASSTKKENRSCIGPKNSSMFALAQEHERETPHAAMSAANKRASKNTPSPGML